MDESKLFWWGLSLLAVVTVYWAAVWWILPWLFRDRDRDPEPPKSSGGTRTG